MRPSASRGICEKAVLFSRISSARGQASFLLVSCALVFLGFLALNITNIHARIFFFIFLGIGVFSVAFLRTQLAIVLLIFSMLLSPELSLLQTNTQRAVVLRFDDIFIFMIFLGWLAKLAVFKELGLFKKTVLNIPIRNYVFVCLVSTGLGILAGQQNLTRSLFYLLKYFEYFMLYFLVVNNLEDMREAKLFVFLMIVTFFVVSVYGIYSHRALGFRATAPFEGGEGEPNTLAGYIVLLTAVTMGLLFYFKTSVRIRMALCLIIGVALLTLLYTLSRGGWLAFVFMYTTFIFLAPRRRALLILIAAFFIIISPFLIPQEAKQRFASTFAPVQKSTSFRVMGKNMALDESGSYRLVSLRFGVQEIMKSPIFGHGVPTLSLVDTQFARTAMETGLLGLFALGYLFVRIFRAGRDSFLAAQRCEDGFTQGISIGYIAGFVGLLVHSFSAATFIIIRIMEPFWFLTAIIVSVPFLLEARNRQRGDIFAEGT